MATKAKSDIVQKVADQRAAAEKRRETSGAAVKAQDRADVDFCDGDTRGEVTAPRGKQPDGLIKTFVACGIRPDARGGWAAQENQAAGSEEGGTEGVIVDTKPQHCTDAAGNPNLFTEGRGGKNLKFKAKSGGGLEIVDDSDGTGNSERDGHCEQSICEQAQTEGPGLLGTEVAAKPAEVVTAARVSAQRSADIEASDDGSEGSTTHKAQK